MLKKEARARRIFSVTLLVVVATAVFSLVRHANEKTSTSTRLTVRTVSRKDGTTPLAGNLPGDQISSAAGDHKAGVPIAAYRFETAFIPGKPASIPARFETPSAAEVTLRSARLSELIEGGLSALREGNIIRLPLPGNAVVDGRVNLVQRESDGQILIGGELADGGGSFSLGEDDSRFSGRILPQKGDVGYQIETGRDGAAYLLEKKKGAIVCMELPVVIVSRAIVREEGETSSAEHAETPGSSLVLANASTPETALSSRPEATAVAYLDFDGETVTDSGWNNGNTIGASASGLSPAQISEVWQRVAEDFRPFNIDVTTSRARYDNTPAGSRIRCIITQNNAWYGSAGGVAYIGSWSEAGHGSLSATVPCWVFSNLLSLNTRYIADAVSHEIGHTLGLSHDGLESSSGTLLQTYYAGHGLTATSWAPIMGNGYYANVVQWSNGNYGTNGNVGNNTEDDLAIISDGANHTGYVADEAGGSISTASALKYDGAAIATSGVIGRTGDMDIYRFTTNGGDVNFALTTRANALSGEAVLDARLSVYDSSGRTVADANPTGSLYPSITTTLSAGTYYLAVTGVGEGQVPGMGYTSYGSLGRYELKGSGTRVLSDQVVIDSEDTARVALKGTWTPSTYYSGYLGSNYLSDGKTGALGGKHVRFVPDLSASTAYDIYIRWAASKDRADNAPVDIVHAGGTKTLTVNQRINHGAWVFLGTYGFNAGISGSVTLRNDGANGFVTADAVKFERADASLAAPSSPLIIDASDSTGIARSGTWTPSTYTTGYHGRDYLTDGNTSKSTVKKVRFSPSLPVSGAYAVYAKWTSGTNRATNVQIDITSATGTSRQTVNQQINHGIWYLLGTYSFKSGASGNVTISNEGANGFVVADAIKFEQLP